MPADCYRYFIHLSYLGSNYHGWQIQAGSITVQELLQNALSLVLRQRIAVMGAGRTDTGVHARQFFAHFDTSIDPAGIQALQLKFKLNRMLPADIAIKDFFLVKNNAHARFDAISRTYQYFICTEKDAYQSGLSWLYERTLDPGAMQEASDMLLQHTNFASFARSNTQVKTYDCQVTRANWVQQDHMIIFTIRANRFLRNMVRAIVGTITDVGLGKISPAAFKQIILSQNRQKAGYSAPARGLHLTDIQYPKEIFVQHIAAC